MREKLLLMDKEEILEFIRERRSCKFDMSGYGHDNSANIKNMNLLNEFADCGIYDYVQFLSLEAYKGSVQIHYQWFFGGSDKKSYHSDFDYTGWSTANIIYDIINKLYIIPTITRFIGHDHSFNKRRFF